MNSPLQRLRADGPNPPARYCIRADLVRPEFLVEIASVAHLAQ
jgi:aminoacrylate peracid reductase